MKSPGGGKALLIEKPTVNGVVSPFPVAINTMGSRKRMAHEPGREFRGRSRRRTRLADESQAADSLRETMKLLGTALDLRHAKPKLVKDGPCKEVIHKFDAPPTRTEPWPAAPDHGHESSLATQSIASTRQSLPPCSTSPSKNAGRSTAAASSPSPASSPKTPTPASATSACIASRFTTTAPPACTGSSRKSARATAAVTTKPARACPSPFSSAAIPCSPSPPPRRCPMASMNSSSPVISAKNPSNW